MMNQSASDATRSFMRRIVIDLRALECIRRFEEDAQTVTRAFRRVQLGIEQLAMGQFAIVL